MAVRECRTVYCLLVCLSLSNASLRKAKKMVTQQERMGFEDLGISQIYPPPTPMSNSHKRLQVQRYINPVILFSSSWIENQSFEENSSAVFLRDTIIAWCHTQQINPPLHYLQ